ncbi:MAG: tRNA (adenosine(37)-N6)-threonylcarbamoyltransferase complex ATPase subunit type 1 TsaE [Armatimonadetes bacterium]|nr:tRNA (adenosine(37)-N6)-threonylcarbamoyltransferase complex ATPase subunit type 1 TsaE [Armatimonadota bacterium]
MIGQPFKPVAKWHNPPEWLELTNTIRSLAETDRFGRQLAAALTPGDVVGLVGELGSGKTTLIQSIGRALGVGESIYSPTFVIAHHYTGRVPVYHLDAYRLETRDMASSAALDDYFETDGITLVEWADHVLDMLPERTIWLYLQVVSEHKRQFQLFLPQPLEPRWISWVDGEK